MSRTIKFRAWDSVDYMSNAFALQDLQDQRIKFADDCVVMQFTGLHDTNENEIYEGDILSATKDNKSYAHEVIYKDGSYRAGTVLTNDINAKFEREVIGNIYENPELLK